MNKRLAMIIALQSILIVVLFWVLVFYGKDEYEAYTMGEQDEIEAPNHVAKLNGKTVIHLSNALQQESGISAIPLVAGQADIRLSSYGNVLSLDSLMDLRGQYLNASANAQINRAALVSSLQEYDRMKALNQDNHNVSDRAVTQALAAYQSDLAKVQAAEQQMHNIADNMRQQWGESLTKAATTDKPAAMFASLLSRKQVLVQVVLPFSAHTQPANSLTVRPIGEQTSGEDDRQENPPPDAQTAHSDGLSPIQAKYFTEAPKADNTAMGKTYFYLAPASRLRAGMRVSVQLKPEGNTATGVIIPNSAVVWHSGKSWVYQQIDAEHFSRIPIAANQASAQGWFETAHFKAGDKVVTQGAQLLLSEEFKFQIKNENDD